ncbi:S8 family serine peptidase [Rossellomorea aquimaris]|uniref:S8 family serine peptidase n=2 Tax=Rossellomorea aquimaris TaxID=189382 RepID=A0A5D4UP27_9BACI|nr:S8 family serine peptidase [Rossellomorea aquimaris]TYS83623.1 S8 family serine peptidase [Rossellomorea aquimaris]TYS89172.1 S8 family serine peptidase [Rossellomorea aquimaris]
MKSSMKKKLSAIGMSALIAGSIATPAGAEFELPNKNGHAGQAIPLSKEAKAEVDNLWKDSAIGHPLYGQKSEKFDPKENIRLIVEVDVEKKDKPEQKVEQVKGTFMKKRSGGSEIIHTYSEGFYGFSMETTIEEAEKIKKVDGVKDIRIAKTYEHHDINSNELVEAMNVWTKYNYTGEGMIVAIVDSGIDHRHEALQLTENGKEHAKYNEENIQSTLNETEVNDIWYSDKVPTGYDWADKDTDVIPASSSHGTHVAGIVGAFEESQKKAVGVAPDVQLIAEKVFSDTQGYAYDDDIAAGIYHAVEVGADVINMSLGSDAGIVDPNDPVQRAVEYATDNGVLVVASAGNSSYSTKQNLLPNTELPLAKNPDIGVVGDPGITPSALQVASSENELMRVESLELNDGTMLGYQNQSNSKKLIEGLEAGKDYELVFVGEANKEELEGVDLEGKIAVVKPGDTYSTYSPFQFRVAGKGAAALIVIPPDESSDYPNLIFSSNSIPAVTTELKSGNTLMETLQNGETITVELSDEGMWVQNPATEPMSYFSSYGAPTDLSFKPEITAPGGKITSTVLDNQYEAMSGTSMASPQVAGGAALLLQKYYQELGLPKNEETVLKAKMALMNTSEILKDPNGENIPYSPRRQGSGLMKIKQAVETPYLLKNNGAPLEQAASVALKEVENKFNFSLNVEPLKGNEFSVFKDGEASVNPEDSEISINVSNKSMENLNFETKYLEGSNIREHAQLEISNSSSEDKTFTSSIEYTELSNDAEKNGVQFSVSNKVKVKAGKSKKTNVFLSVPKTAGEGIYEGYITLINEEDDTEKYQVPFAVKVAKPTEYDVYVDVLKDGTVIKEFDLNKDGNVDKSNEYLTLSSEPVVNASVKVNGKKVSDQNGTSISMKDKDVELNVSVELPEEFRDNQFVEGFVRLVPKNEETPSLTMPYMGFYGDWDSLDNIDESPINGDAYLPYTVLWNDLLELPIGYDSKTGKFNPEQIGYSPNSIVTGIYPSFTAFRNLKEMSLSVQDKDGDTVANITDFSEYSEDGGPLAFSKNIMAYRNFYYGFDGLLWDGRDDDGNILPDGDYYYVYESTLNYEGAEPQQTKIPIKIDAAGPQVENIQVEEQEDGNYKITWNVKEEDTGYKGSMLWVNGKRKSLEAGAMEYISDERPEIVMIQAIDGVQNVGVNYWGNKELLHADPFINFLHVSGSNINENKPASMIIFGYKRLDWHIEISDSEGNMIEYTDIENEHSIYGLKWYPGEEYPNGDYFVTVTGTDENGLSLTSEPKKMTVKH